MISTYDVKERTSQLEKLAPIRERALKNLSTMHKKRIDHRTVVLVKQK